MEKNINDMVGFDFNNAQEQWFKDFDRLLKKLLNEGSLTVEQRKLFEECMEIMDKKENA